jgi:redox-sensitive bicupin YhaK (pirin superfamily)
VIRGSYGSATSAIEAPSPINYLAVRLKAGERWRYQPPTGHTVVWVAVGAGAVTVPDELRHDDLAAFEPLNEAIEFQGQSDAELVVGSAVPHDHDLVLGYHSVHTSVDALREAAARISAIQARLMQEGRL